LVVFDKRLAITSCVWSVPFEIVMITGINHYPRCSQLHVTLLGVA